MSEIQCIVDDCQKPAKSRDYCSMHYGRWRVSGDPLVTRSMMRKPKPVESPPPPALPKWADDFNPTTNDCKPRCCRTGTKSVCFNRWICRCHQPMEVYQ